jgi:hypothetical protein
LIASDWHTWLIWLLSCARALRHSNKTQRPLAAENAPAQMARTEVASSLLGAQASAWALLEEVERAEASCPKELVDCSVFERRVPASHGMLF